MAMTVKFVDELPVHSDFLVLFFSNTRHEYLALWKEKQTYFGCTGYWVYEHTRFKQPSILIVNDFKKKQMPDWAKSFGSSKILVYIRQGMLWRSSSAVYNDIISFLDFSFNRDFAKVVIAYEEQHGRVTYNINEYPIKFFLLTGALEIFPKRRKVLTKTEIVTLYSNKETLLLSAKLPKEYYLRSRYTSHRDYEFIIKRMHFNRMKQLGQLLDEIRFSGKPIHLFSISDKVKQLLDFLFAKKT